MFEESLMTGPELGPDPAAAVVSPHNGTLQRLPELVPDEKRKSVNKFNIMPMSIKSFKS